MERKRVSSELYKLLDNVNYLMMGFLFAGRTPSRELMLKAIGTEVKFLTQKLKCTRKRWKTFLPFMEAYDVDFAKWSGTVSEWIVEIRKTSCWMSTSFIIDFVYDVECELGDNLSESVPKWCDEINKKKAETIPNWESIAFDEEETSLIDACRVVIAEMAELRAELDNLNEFTQSALTERQFMVLTYRLYHEYCLNAVKAAEGVLNTARNGWPKRFVAKKASQLKERYTNMILENEQYKQLTEFIDLDRPDVLGDGSFGQFLFAKRSKLEISDVQIIVKILEVIRLVNEFIKQQQVKPNIERKHKLSEEESRIVSYLVNMVNKVEWKEGWSAESVSIGLKKILDVDGFGNLNDDEKSASKQLWSQLKKRRGLSAEESLKRTWLNIVGWCVSKGMLECSGSPALCKTFYPKAKEDDYKAIDQGKNEMPISFNPIIPLLTKYLKQKK